MAGPGGGKPPVRKLSRVRILPEFGEMRMMDILPERAREWVADMKAGE
jgi:hypothetical protein